MKSTLTVVFGSLVLISTGALACPYSDKSQEMTYLESDHGKKQSMVEHSQEVDKNLLVELKQEGKDTKTN